MSLAKSLEKNLKNTMKITPETYKRMNDIFKKEGIPVLIEVPTQERIDEWLKQSRCSP